MSTICIFRVGASIRIEAQAATPAEAVFLCRRLERVANDRRARVAYLDGRLVATSTGLVNV